MVSLDKITEIAQHFAGLAIEPGDFVIDATAGNGFDTLFLADRVGAEGKVYAFDVQDHALQITADKLQKAGFSDRVKLIHSGHERLADFTSDQVSVVMYNLGYLPGGNKEIITKSSTSIESLGQGLNLLKNEGVITIVLYPGHEEGYLESKEIIKYAVDLASNDYLVYHLRVVNRFGSPPELLVIKKSFS